MIEVLVVMWVVSIAIMLYVFFTTRKELNQNKQKVYEPNNEQVYQEHQKKNKNQEREERDVEKERKEKISSAVAKQHLEKHKRKIIHFNGVNKFLGTREEFEQMKKDLTVDGIKVDDFMEGRKGEKQEEKTTVNETETEKPEENKKEEEKPKMNLDRFMNAKKIIKKK